MKLYLFDLDGTVIRSFLREGAERTPENYAEVELLPGRREKLDELRANGAAVAFVTNQGGVAFGYQTVGEVMRKVKVVGYRFGFEAPTVCVNPNETLGVGYDDCMIYVAFGHPKASVPEYLVDDDWRKPGGWMLTQAMLDYNVPAEQTIFVGDMDTDRQAAENARVAYDDAEDFFA